MSQKHEASAKKQPDRWVYLGVVLIGTLLIGSSLALAAGPHGFFGRGHGGSGG